MQRLDQRLELKGSISGVAASNKPVNTHSSSAHCSQRTRHHLTQCCRGANRLQANLTRVFTCNVLNIWGGGGRIHDVAESGRRGSCTQPAVMDPAKQEFG
jgi:hypothetical protein